MVRGDGNRTRHDYLQRRVRHEVRGVLWMSIACEDIPLDYKGSGGFCRRPLFCPAIFRVVKSFIGIRQMEQSPNMTFKFHARMISILSILTLVDVAMISYAAEDTLLKGATMMIVFGFEVYFGIVA